MKIDLQRIVIEGVRNIRMYLGHQGLIKMYAFLVSHQASIPFGILTKLFMSLVQ